MNALPWEIGQSHVTSVISFRMVKLSARLFPTPSTPLSFFHRPRGSDIITVYFNLHHRHLRNDKSRWTSIPTISYTILFFLFIRLLHIFVPFFIISLSFILSLSASSERNLPAVVCKYFRFVACVTQEAGRPNNARLYLLGDREIGRRFATRNNH